MKRAKKWLKRTLLAVLCMALVIPSLPEFVPGIEQMQTVEAATDWIEISTWKQLEQELASTTTSKLIITEDLQTEVKNRTDYIPYTLNVYGTHTLDLNGHTLCIKEVDQDCSWGIGDIHFFTLQTGANLTINDSDGDGRIEFYQETIGKNTLWGQHSPRNELTHFWVEGDNVTLTINGGTMECGDRVNLFVSEGWNYRNPDESRYNTNRYANGFANDRDMFNRYDGFSDIISSGILVNNRNGSNVNVYINGGEFINRSESSSLQKYYFDGGKNRPTAFFMNDSKSEDQMHVYVNDGYFDSANGASIALENVDLHLLGGKYYFGYKFLIHSDITEYESKYGAGDHIMTTGSDVHDGNIGALPTAEQIGENLTCAYVKFGSDVYRTVEAYNKRRQEEHSHFSNDRRSVTFEIEPTVQKAGYIWVSEDGERAYKVDDTTGTLSYVKGNGLTFRWRGETGLATDYVTYYHTGNGTLPDTITQKTIMVMNLYEYDSAGNQINEAQINYGSRNAISLDRLGDGSNTWASGVTLTFKNNCTYKMLISGIDSLTSNYDKYGCSTPLYNTVTFSPVPDAMETVALYLSGVEVENDRISIGAVSNTVRDIQIKAKDGNVRVSAAFSAADTVALKANMELSATLTLTTVSSKAFSASSAVTLLGKTYYPIECPKDGTYAKYLVDLYTECSHADCTKQDASLHVCDDCGMVLSHNFSDWTVVREELKHTCENCGYTETKPLGGEVKTILLNPTDKYSTGLFVGDKIPAIQISGAIVEGAEYEIPAENLEYANFTWYEYDRSLEEITNELHILRSGLYTINEDTFLSGKRYVIGYEIKLSGTDYYFDKNSMSFFGGFQIGNSKTEVTLSTTPSEGIEYSDSFTRSDGSIGYSTIKGFILVSVYSIDDLVVSLPEIQPGMTVQTLEDSMAAATAKPLTNYSVIDPDRSVDVTITVMSGDNKGTVIMDANYVYGENGGNWYNRKPDTSTAFEPGVEYLVTLKTGMITRVDGEYVDHYIGDVSYDNSPYYNGAYALFMGVEQDVATINALYLMTAVVENARINITEPQFGKPVELNLTKAANVDIKDYSLKRLESPEESLEGAIYTCGTYELKVYLKTRFDGTPFQYYPVESNGILTHVLFNEREADSFSAVTTGSGAKQRTTYEAVITYELPHNWVLDSHVDASCTKAGEDKLHCTKCGETKTVVVPIKQHEIVQLNSRPANCLYEGRSRQCYQCVNCEQYFADEEATEVLTDITSPKNPENHAPQLESEPLYRYNANVHWHACDRCLTQIGEMERHTLVDNGDGTQQCSVCGMVVFANHTVTVEHGGVYNPDTNDYQSTGTINCTQTVCIKATVAEDEVFLGWEVKSADGKIEIRNEKAEETYFTMIDSDVVLTAIVKKSECIDETGFGEHLYGAGYLIDRGMGYPETTMEYKCVHCGKVVWEWIDYTYIAPEYPAVQYSSLSLDGKIGVNFYMTVPKDMDNVDSCLEYVFANNTGYFELGNDALKTTVNGVEMYKFTVEVPAAYYDEIIQIRFNACRDSWDEAKYVPIVSGANEQFGYNYSIEQYCTEFLESTDENVESAKPLVRALKNYCLAASSYVNNEEYVNREMEKEMDAVILENLHTYTISGCWHMDYKSPELLGFSLIMDSGTDLRLYLEGENVNDCSVTILTKNGNNLEKTKHNYYFTSLNKNQKSLTICDFAVTELADEQIITIKNDRGLFKEIDVSPISYVFAARYGDETTQTVAKALYLYYQAAMEYIAK